MSQPANSQEATMYEEGPYPYRHVAAEDRWYANDRPATEPCERGEVGCCIDHTQDLGSCEPW